MTTPSEIKIHKKSATLELLYEDGSSHTLRAEYLRVFSPSAEVQGHSPTQAVLQFGKRNVQFRDIEPQGHYAIKIVFSDGHDSGIFSWEYLKSLAINEAENWASYLLKLQQAGKSRDSQFIKINST
jgi:DUF971 family protein